MIALPQVISGVISIPKYCIFSLSKTYISEKKNIVQEPKAFDK